MGNSRKCAIPECDKYLYAKGLCRMHNQRARAGRPMHDISRLDTRNHCSFQSAHLRVRVLWGSASRYSCVACGGPAREWAYDGTDPSQLYGDTNQGRRDTHSYYSRFPEFYMPMCVKCHRSRDNTLAKLELREYRQWKTETGLTLEGVRAAMTARKI
ncbi:HNH endonuclease [Mycobacterium phage Manda]|nr:HNH endonuclease [Mycobacterium phage Manda]